MVSRPLEALMEMVEVSPDGLVVLAIDVIEKV